jgi:hypothetical protein
VQFTLSKLKEWVPPLMSFNQELLLKVTVRAPVIGTGFSKTAETIMLSMVLTIACSNVMFRDLKEPGVISMQ